ncbi:MAG: mandelate racemase/muconate lactonizing enzyme family protein [Chloroflexi bacterium]|nr:mandelate racemase/muconate lactonizing enzyme family protein [Chloroflexota bacterium]MDA1282658.1 mandelate racemase/muconate lactonizing enzyme family protein [Chloroflexota bacterium]
MSGNIKVTDVKIVNLRTVKHVGKIEPAWSPGRDMSFDIGGGSFTEVHTDAGITGIGPGMHLMFVDAVKEYLVGRSAFAVEDHAVALNYYVPNLHYQGTAGVDMALWDIIGKAANLPLYKLWGGEKEKIIPYASMVALSTPEERAEQASSLKEQGWQAMKIRIHNESIADDIKIVEAVRDAVGQDFTIMVDANQAQSSGMWQPGVMWNFKRAYETAVELQDLDVYWLEEPLKRYDFEGLAELNAKVEMRIAGGENNPGLHEFVQMCDMDTYKLLQPESMVMNGMTNLRKIGNLAELHGKEIVPHHGGGNIGVIAHQHLVASWRHAPFMELLHDPPIGHYKNKFSIMANAPEVDSEGFMPLPTGPGIGIEIDPDLIIND